jgi:hypothetical protein
MAAPPLWIHAVAGFMAGILSVAFTWLVSKLLRYALREPEQPGLPPAPHVVSICYDPALDRTTLQYSNGEQLFISGSLDRSDDGPDTTSLPLPASPGEPLSTADFRELLDHPGDGAAVAASGVHFNQEGGFREN